MYGEAVKNSRAVDIYSVPTQTTGTAQAGRRKPLTVVPEGQVNVLRHLVAVDHRAARQSVALAARREKLHLPLAGCAALVQHASVSFPSGLRAVTSSVTSSVSTIRLTVCLLLSQHRT